MLPSGMEPETSRLLAERDALTKRAMRAAEKFSPAGHIRRPSTISHATSDITAAGARRVSLLSTEMRQNILSIYGLCNTRFVPVGTD